MQILKRLTKQLTTNQFFSGVIGGGLIGSGIYYLKAIPVKLIETIKYMATFQITIISTDPLFLELTEWLNSIINLKYVRNLRVAYHNDDNNDHTSDKLLILSPGIGTHVIFYKNRLMLIERNNVGDSNKLYGGSKVIEEITLTMVGRDKQIIIDLINDIKLFCKKENKLKIHTWNNYHDHWYTQLKEKRNLSTIFLNNDIKSKLLSDITKFIESKSWYEQKGIPYHRGYLFHGPPGTGKTSLAVALASEINYPIYYINLNSFKNDSDMIEAFSEMKKQAIILIEDIDTTKLTNVRTDDNIEDRPNSISLSVLLNLIDGILSNPDKILIFTTNHLNKIDPAIIRDGRIDIIEYIGNLEKEEIVNMIMSFDVNIDQSLIKDNINISGATLQNILLKNKDVNDIIMEINKYEK